MTEGGEEEEEEEEVVVVGGATETGVKNGCGLEVGGGEVAEVMPAGDMEAELAVNVEDGDF